MFQPTFINPCTAAERLTPVREADPVLRDLRKGALGVGLERWIPCGVSEVSCLLARYVSLPNSDERAVAIMLPRGRQHLAGVVALYLAYARANGLLPLRGNVSLATNDTETRTLLSRITASGNGGKAPAVRRLVRGPQSRPLTGTAGSRGISQRDREVLLHVPGFQPRLATNVVSVSVVDALSCNEDYWQPLRAWAIEGNRSQIWIGQLGDPAFDAFCAHNDIPVWRWDFAALAAEEVVGRGRLALGPLIARAQDGPSSFGYRVCDDGNADELLRELEQRFASMHRRSNGVMPPEVVVTARRLTYLLARLPLPLDAYAISAVNEHRTLQPRKALTQVRDAPKARFAGRWAHLYETDWAAVRGALTQLFDHVEAEHPKYYEIMATVERARRERTRLLIRCGSRAEARALGPALVADGVISLDELLEDDSFIDIGWFGRQSPPLDYGRAGGRLLTVITEAPPPFRAPVYTTAERGGVEAILFPTEAVRLRRNAAKAAVAASGAESNAQTVARLMRQAVVPSGDPVPAVVQALDPNGFTGRKPVRPAEPLTDPTARMMDFFDELDGLADLDGTGRDAGVPGGEDPADGDAVTGRVLLTTDEDVAVFLDPSGTVDVVLRDRLEQVRLADLRRGQLVALVDGGQRSDLLHRLLAAWDNAFGPARVFYDLYLQALAAAYEKAGGTDQALADAVGVSPSTVRTWRIGDKFGPQQDDVLLALLERSELQVAIDNAPKIRHYLGRVRGMHRLIGRVFNHAAAQAAVSDRGEARAQLEALTGLDLRDFFDSVQVMAVARVKFVDAVPHRLTGRFLPVTDPLVQKAIS
ncbi:hypothetical protein ACVU7I_05100 [Patulibacter sp. S7RM1-6]